MPERQDRLFTPAFLALTVADLAYFTAAGMVIGVTPFFAAGRLGAGAAGVGVAVGGSVRELDGATDQHTGAARRHWRGRSVGGRVESAGHDVAGDITQAPVVAAGVRPQCGEGLVGLGPPTFGKDAFGLFDQYPAVEGGLEFVRWARRGRRVRVPAGC